MSWAYRFCVDHVHDGDSVEGVLDMGLAHYLGRAPRPLYGIRFAGIDAPELKTPEGKAARDYLQTLVVPGQVLDVTSIGWDKYAPRIDAIVFTESGVNLCDAMVDAGHAVRKDYT